MVMQIKDLFDPFFALLPLCFCLLEMFKTPHSKLIEWHSSFKMLSAWQASLRLLISYWTVRWGCSERSIRLMSVFSLFCLFSFSTLTSHYSGGQDNDLMKCVSLCVCVCVWQRRPGLNRPGTSFTTCSCTLCPLVCTQHKCTKTLVKHNPHWALWVSSHWLSNYH